MKKKQEKLKEPIYINIDEEEHDSAKFKQVIIMRIYMIIINVVTIELEVSITKSLART